METKADSVQAVFPSDFIFPSENVTISEAGKGKIRHVGGYCVAKCRHRLCTSLRSTLFVPGKEKDIKIMNKQIECLDKMTISYTDIYITTIHAETLDETSRKQNSCESLVNITDSVYEFFEIVELTLRKIMTHETLLKKNKYMYRYILSEILSDEHIYELFMEKCLDFQESDTLYAPEKSNFQLENSSYIPNVALPLYNKLIRLFVTVTISQFRRDYLRVIKREKGKALRKKVKDRKELTFPNIQSIHNDSSKDKSISHLKLKTIALENKSFYEKFKKIELINILNAYGKNATLKSTKKELGEALYQVLQSDSCVKIPQPHLLNPIQHKVDEPVASTSRQCPHEIQAETISLTSDTESGLINGNNTENPKMSQNIKSKQTSRKRKGGQTKGKGKRSKKCKHLGEYDSDSCGVCHKIYQEDEEWICCDSCSVWYHRECVELGDDDWKYFSQPDAVFICPMCR